LLLDANKVVAEVKQSAVDEFDPSREIHALRVYPAQSQSGTGRFSPTSKTIDEHSQRFTEFVNAIDPKRIFHAALDKLPCQMRQSPNHQAPRSRFCSDSASICVV
jgi:hypothetical protein